MKRLPTRHAFAAVTVLAATTLVPLSLANAGRSKSEKRAPKAPVATVDRAATPPGSPIRIPVLLNDRTAIGNLQVVRVGTPWHGTATLNSDRTVTYAPTSGYQGRDVFTYTITNGKRTARGRVVVTVSPSATTTTTAAPASAPTATTAKPTTTTAKPTTTTATTTVTTAAPATTKPTTAPTTATTKPPATPAPTTAAPTTTAAPRPTATGRFYVVGKDIIAPDGSKFVPLGANVGANVVSWSPPTYAFTSQGATANGHVNDALAWGWNMIRVNVICNPSGNPSLQQTVDGVQRVIDEYTAKKIVVMPECHDVTGKDAALSDPRYVGIHAFWDAIITRNGSNPYVWVNYVNEPFTGGSSDPRWAATAKALYDRVRSKGTENLFVWDFPGWGQAANDLASNDAGPALVSGRCNVVLSWHNYGAAGNAAAMSSFAQSLISKNLAVIVGEAGYDWAGYRSETTTFANEKAGADWTFANLGRYGFGMIWWHATGTRNPDEPHAPRMNGVGAWYNASVPLSAGGQQLYNAGQSKPTFPKPAVDLRASGCASTR